MKRKLASIQTIHDIQNIENADRIQKAKVLEYQVVIPKGLFNENEPVVFFEADAFLPIERRYEFLRSDSYKNSRYMGEGFKVRAKELRGEVTLGLCMKLSDFPELEGCKIGDDVSDLLKVRKWDEPIGINNLASTHGNKPYYIQTTDEIRLQSVPKLIEEIKGKPYYISQKIDGTSITMYSVDGKFGATTREKNILLEKHGVIPRYIEERGLKDKFLDFGKDLIVQGEFAGPNIQKNVLGLSEYKWFIFDAFLRYDNGNFKSVDLDTLVRIAEFLKEDTVPILEVGDEFTYSIDDLVLFSKSGFYKNGRPQEGIVVKSKDYVYSEELKKRFSFKVLNNRYLTKEEK